MSARFPFKKLALVLALANIQFAHAGEVVGLGASNMPNAVSGDGSLAVGQVSLSSGSVQATSWPGGTAKNLSSVTIDTTANGVSGDGALIAGKASSFDAASNYIEQGFKWTAAGGMVSLGGLASGQNYSAAAVSSDGNVIVGKATLADGMSQHAVRWVAAGAKIEDINGNGFTYSSAQAVSSDGSVVVGYGQNADGFRAFRWTSAGMNSLGTLAGKNSSEATAVSADGSVVAGVAYTSMMADHQAFRWTQADGMVSLGSLADNKYSQAKAINSDGSVIVGHAYNDQFSASTAFRWTKIDGMDSVGNWLTTNGVNVGTAKFTKATGVSADGSVVVGMAEINGTEQGYIARVGAGGSGGTVSGGGSSGSAGGANGGLTTTQEQVQSFTGVAASSGAVGSFAGMALFGAHHRVLADNGLEGNRCFWATGDLGGANNGSNRQYLGEVGVCGDFGLWRLGGGVGASQVNQDLQLAGRSRLNGQHAYLEADYQLGKGLIASVSGFYGAWSADINRHYMNAGVVDASSGSTDVQATAGRVRLDWLNLAQLGSVSLSPFVAYSHIQTRANGYSESGGGFAAQFDTYRQTLRDTRLGVTAMLPVANQTELRLSAEAINQSRSNDQLNAAIGGVVVPVSSQQYQENQARFGAEIDHRLSKQSVINASMHLTAGSQAAYVASVGWKMGF